jgi:hypothetical protein
LTYGPTDEGSRLAARLILAQHADGSFGENGEISPVATAVALCGLMFHLDQYQQISLEADDQLRSAVDRAATALAEWILSVHASETSSEELGLVRRQLAMTSVLGVTASDMLHDSVASASASVENDEQDGSRRSVAA